jgi:hypothetical protein
VIARAAVLNPPAATRRRIGPIVNRQRARAGQLHPVCAGGVCAVESPAGHLPVNRQRSGAGKLDAPTRCNTAPAHITDNCRRIGRVQRHRNSANSGRRAKHAGGCIRGSQGDTIGERKRPAGRRYLINSHVHVDYNHMPRRGHCHIADARNDAANPRRGVGKLAD